MDLFSRSSFLEERVRCGTQMTREEECLPGGRLPSYHYYYCCIVNGRLAADGLLMAGDGLVMG